MGRPALRRSPTVRPAAPLLALLALIMLLAGLVPGTTLPDVAHAAGMTRYVDDDALTSSDVGKCLNKDAPCRTIGYAHDQALDGDTISIAAGTYNEFLIISKNLSLAGKGATTTKMINPRPDGQTSVIGIAPGVTVSMSGLTLENGYASAAGGVANTGVLVLTAMVIQNNRADANGGGGIYNYGGGTVTISDSTISGNIAVQQDGGGIYNTAGSTVTIINSSISGNTASEGAGGGIYNLGAMSLADSTVSGNRSGDTGGIANGGMLTITNSTISGNAADLNPQNSRSSGGIRNSGTLIVNGSTIKDNVALSNGGGLLSEGTVTLNDSIVSGNRAASYGGGIANWGTLTLNRSTVIQNILEGNDTGHSGGGIYNASSGQLTIEASEVISNTVVGPAQIPGGVRQGGGIYSGGALTITNSSVRGNRGPQGGGIYVAGGSAALENSVISQNTAEEGSGGGIVNLRDSELTLRTSQVIDNTTSTVGGGIYTAGTLAAFDSTISRNRAIAGNKSGGGIYNDSGNTTLERSTVSGNMAESGGGITSATASSTLTVNNSTVSGNSANFAGGIHRSGPTTLLNSTITANTATASTGGVGTDNPQAPPAVLRNTILAGNISPSAPDCSGAVTSQGYNLLGSDAGCAFTQATGDQVSVADPKLGPLQDNGEPTPTHALLSGSPAIDTGSPDNCPATDQRGVARPLDGNTDSVIACDIGAFERQPAELVIGNRLNPQRDVYGIGNQAGVSSFDRFTDLFEVPQPTRIVTETQQLATISATNGLSLPIELAALDVHAVLPLSITEQLSNGSVVVPNPRTFLLYEVVKAFYEDPATQYYDGVVKSGLCAGMTTTVAEFQRKTGAPPPLTPQDFDPAATAVVSLTNNITALQEKIQDYHGMQISAPVLEHLAQDAPAGGHFADAGRYLDHIEARLRDPNWWEDPEIVGIVQSREDCESVEVGHALLPYALERGTDWARVYVYDPNYPATPGSSQNTAVRAIEFALRNGIWSWTYRHSARTIWHGTTIFSMPVRLFRERPGTLPTEDGLLLVSGGQEGAWGGQISAWGGQISAWGDIDGNITGCFDIKDDGQPVPVFVNQISKSLRLITFNGPRGTAAEGAIDHVPDTLFIPNAEVEGKRLTFTSQGGEVSDMLIFGKDRVVGYLGQATDKTTDTLTVDSGLSNISLQTSDVDQGKQITLYTMQTSGADDKTSETRIYAVSNVPMAAGESLKMTVSADGDSVTLVNSSATSKTLTVGVAVIGNDVAGSRTDEVTIGANESIVIVPNPKAAPPVYRLTYLPFIVEAR